MIEHIFLVVVLHLRGLLNINLFSLECFKLLYIQYTLLIYEHILLFYGIRLNIYLFLKDLYRHYLSSMNIEIGVILSLYIGEQVLDWLLY